MPSDVAMEVGPTVVNPAPKNYQEATEKYAGQTKVVELPDDGLTLANYQGGLPFPNPAEPHQGWKILANVWYYIPASVIHRQCERLRGQQHRQHRLFDRQRVSAAQASIPIRGSPGSRPTRRAGSIRSGS